MRTYSSKLLLFGEHILLLGGSALALPIPVFTGKWVEKGADPALKWQGKLLAFAESEQLQQVAGLDAETFYQDIQHGLVFESNIPIGYGLGSSGALCAGVFDRYCRNKTEDLFELKGIFAQMESFFHGASSGIDPLTSYIQKPLLIRNKAEVSIVEIPPWPNAPTVFLIDSGLPRQTGPLVRWFLDQSKQAAFSEKLAQHYLPAHEALVQSWLAADADLFWPNLQQVSQFQLDNFAPMIPASLHSLWKKSIEKQEVVFKICGAGGGGFTLGFSRDMDAVQALAKQFNIVFPFIV